MKTAEDRQARIGDIGVRFVWHTNAESLVLRFLNVDPECPVESVDDVMVGGFDESAPETGRSFLATVESHGCWAFASTEAKEVHYWHEPGYSREAIAMLLGHEMGHILGEPKEDPGQDEDMADTYGRATVAVMRQMFPDPERAL